MRPTLSQKLIREFQRGNPFTHASLYLGNDWIICGATPELGVAPADLETKPEDTCIWVRRVPEIDDDARGRMAQAAADLRGNPYAFRQIFEKALERFRKISATASEVERRGMICSTLCEHAILEGTLGGTQIRKFSNQVVSPADLVESKALIDVEIGWRRNPRSAAAKREGKSQRQK